MKKVIVFRHGEQEDLGLKPSTANWALPARLTEKGIELMHSVALSHEDLLRECEWFFTSPLIRAQESLYAMTSALGISLGYLDIRVQFCLDLWTPVPKVWYSDDPNCTVKKQWQEKPQLVEKEGERFLGFIKETARTISKGDSALCVSHGGTMDAGLAAAKVALGNEHAFKKIQDLQKGEGVIFVFEDYNILRKVEELRHAIGT